MKTSEFDFHLPPKQIAQVPVASRSASRLLVVRRDSGDLEHRMFHELPNLLQRHDLLVLNDTRVIPARVFGRKAGTGGKVELLFLEEVRPKEWDVLMRCSRRPSVGSWIELDGKGLRAEVLADGELGRARLRMTGDRPLVDFLIENGQTPLPPYIRREAGLHEDDPERYQTVYAAVPGAVAAPTAGLHFDETVFARLDVAGVQRCKLTLHVGLGTFRPVTSDTVEDHDMEAERYVVPAATADAVAAARSDHGRVVAVGSTAVRTLETVATDERQIVAGEGRTNLFIYPPYKFKVVDAMVTNFHLPQSTLLMMVSALAGTELMRHAYDVAVREKYRFFSYGDSMLIV